MRISDGVSGGKFRDLCHRLSTYYRNPKVSSPGYCERYRYTLIISIVYPVASLGSPFPYQNNFPHPISLHALNLKDPREAYLS